MLKIVSWALLVASVLLGTAALAAGAFWILPIYIGCAIAMGWVLKEIDS